MNAAIIFPMTPEPMTKEELIAKYNPLTSSIAQSDTYFPLEDYPIPFPIPLTKEDINIAVYTNPYP